MHRRAWARKQWTSMRACRNQPWKPGNHFNGLRLQRPCVRRGSCEANHIPVPCFPPENLPFLSFLGFKHFDLHVTYIISSRIRITLSFLLYFSLSRGTGTSGRQQLTMAAYEESGGDGYYGGRPSRPFEGGVGLPRRPSISAYRYIVTEASLQTNMRCRTRH